jgi:hypothetical protein
MAGIVERSPNQLPELTTKAKDNIGNFNLSLILKNRNWTTKEESDPFKNVIMPYIHKYAKAGIEKLTDTFNLDSLRWTDANELPSLSKLLIGKDIPYHAPIHGNPRWALATIELARRARTPEQTLSHDDKVPFYLRIAGVNKEQNRIIAAKYDLENGNSLKELSISISEQEAVAQSDFFKKNSGEMSKVMTSINYGNGNYYKTAGLMTLGMINTVREKSDPSESSQTAALTIKFGDNEPILEKIGYQIARLNGNIAIELLKSEATENYKLPVWKVNVPATLPKAQ